MLQKTFLSRRAHGFVVLCFVMVILTILVDSWDSFTNIFEVDPLVLG